MTAALLLAALLSQEPSIPVFRLHQLSPRFDAIALFLPGGRLPLQPWHGLPDRTRERLWACSCYSMLVQRTSWSAYIVIAPPGLGDSILPGMLELETDCLEQDASGWSRALALSSSDPAGAVLVMWDVPVLSNEIVDAPPAIPVRRSEWLASTPDTLMLTGQWCNGVILLTGEALLGQGQAWRGAGSEVILTQDGPVAATVITSSEATPAQIEDLAALSHPWDSVFADVWGPVFSAIDSLVAAGRPVSGGGLSVVWLKGTGSGPRLEPWRMLVSPPPPSRASFTPAWPGRMPENYPSFEPPEIDGVVRLVLSFPGFGEDLLAVAAGIVERILSRSLLPLVPGAVSVSVTPGIGSLDVALIGAGDLPDEDSIRALIRAGLGPTSLCPPEAALVRNAALRASLQAGRELPIPLATDLVLPLAEAIAD